MSWWVDKNENTSWDFTAFNYKMEGIKNINLKATIAKYLKKVCTQFDSNQYHSRFRVTLTRQIVTKNFHRV